MSVLVEAPSLIVPRSVLDASYPGGTDAFMHKMADSNHPGRLVRADEELVSVSFLSPDDAAIIERELQALGIVSLDENCFYELAFVDPVVGPTMPCDWLDWRRDDDGFTYCWLAGTEPADRMLLAHESGVETWLDFESGQVTTSVVLNESSLPSRSASDEGKDLLSSDGPTEDPLLPVVRAALDAREYKYRQLDAYTLQLDFIHEGGRICVFFSTDDRRDLVFLTARYGTHVPADRRVQVAEAASRINFGLNIGGFEVDFSDGELRYRIGMDVEEGSFSVKMADNVLGFAVCAMDKYQSAFMRIAFGDVEPKVALEAPL